MAAVVKRLVSNLLVIALSVAATATVAVGSVDAHTAAASAASKLSHRVGSCDLHRKQAVASSRTLIVYGKRAGVDTWQGARTIYYACLRPAGKPIEVGRSAESDGEYPPNESMSSLRIAGTFVANSSGSGLADESACSKFLGTNCQRLVRSWLEVVDVKSRRRVRIPLGQPATSVAVSPAGIVAWVLVVGTNSPAPVLQAMILRHAGAGQLTGTARILDTGDIGRSLRFTGATLHWTNSGHTESHTFR